MERVAVVLLDARNYSQHWPQLQTSGAPTCWHFQLRLDVRWTSIWCKCFKDRWVARVWEFLDAEASGARGCIKSTPCILQWTGPEKAALFGIFAVCWHTTTHYSAWVSPPLASSGRLSSQVFGVGMSPVVSRSLRIQDLRNHSSGR